MDFAYSSTIYAFVKYGNLDEAFLGGCPSSEWGALRPIENVRICSKYNECAIPFYEYLFSILGLYFPFIDFEIKVLKHLVVALSQLYPANWTYVKVYQY